MIDLIFAVYWPMTVIAFAAAFIALVIVIAAHLDEPDFVVFLAVGGPLLAAIVAVMWPMTVPLAILGVAAWRLAVRLGERYP